MNSKRSALLVTGLIVIAILVVVNWLVGGTGLMNFRFDLTQNKLYTIAQGTRNILANIKPDEPVTIRFYVTRDSRMLAPNYAKYATTVEDLLLELEKTSDGKVNVQVIDPRPDTEDEDKARADDIAGHVASENGDKAYFGIAVECRDHKEVIPTLNPNTETTLEYDLARAIAKVTRVKKTVVGVMSAMPIAGPAMNIPMMRQQMPQPWVVVEQLRQDYEVKEVPMTTDKIDSDVSILVIIHPADILPKAEFAIDQFVLRGGKVAAFVDPQCAVSSIYNQRQQNPMMPEPQTIPPSSNLKNLFKAWGIGYEPDMVVADNTDGTVFRGNQTLPIFLSIGDKDGGINKSLPATSQLTLIQMFSPGSFTVEKKEGINAVTILQSSPNSMMVDTTAAEKAQRGTPIPNFHAEGHPHILGVQLTGHFKTAFPEGAPKEQAPVAPPMPGGLPPGFPPGGTGGSEADAGAPATKDEKKDAAPAPAPAAAAPKAPETKSADAAKPADAPKPTQAKPAEPAKPAAAATKPADPAKPAGAPKTTPPAPAAATAPAPVAGAPAKPATPAKPAGPPSLKESTNNEGAVFLFSDADMLYDGLCMQQDQVGQLHLMNHNMALLLNLAETLSGGSDLIAVRSRGSTRRQFNKFNEMLRSVEDKYRPQLEKLEQEKTKADEEASKIKQVKVTLDANGNMKIMDPEVEAKYKKAMETSTSLQKQVREIRKEQTRDKDYREMWITVLNLLFVPLLVILFGIVLSMKRHTVQAAK